MGDSMASPLDFSKLLNDPAFQDFWMNMQNIPLQPNVEGISSSMAMTELPQSEKEIQKQIREKFLQSQAQQEEQIKLQQRMLAQELARQKEMGVLGNLDLRPFAQAAKQYGAQTAVVPTAAPEERTEIMQKLQEQIQRGQRGLTQDQIGFLRTMMEDRRSAQAAISDRNAELRETKAVVDPLAKIAFKASEFKQTANQIDTVLDRDEIPVSELTQIITGFGRMMHEVGTQTQQDREAYYTPTMEARFNQFLNKLGVEGTVSSKDPSVKAIVNQMKYAKEAAGRDLLYKTQSIEETYGAPGSVVAYQFKKGKPGYAAVQKSYELANSFLMPSKKQEKSKLDILMEKADKLEKELGGQK